VTFEQPVSTMERGRHWDFGPLDRADVVDFAAARVSPVTWSFSSRFQITRPPVLLSAGTYRLTLLSAIRSEAGQPLDGEPVSLPSGDGAPGGDFPITITLTPPG
jgi:hypothetical protein